MFVLRRTNSPISPQWAHEDFDVFDGAREVGRIYLVDGHGDRETWFWGVALQVTQRKSYGYAISLDEAETAVRAEYEAWKDR